MAALTCAMKQVDFTTGAMELRFWLFHAGVIDLKTAGTGLRTWLYQPTPKPSPLSGSSISRALKLWLISEFFGSMSSFSIRIGLPKYATSRHMELDGWFVPRYSENEHRRRVVENEKQHLWRMKISAFTMCRNADKLYYPVCESLRSALDLVDEFVVVIGDGDTDDRTFDLVSALDSPKIRIVRSTWDTDAFPKGTVHAQQSDLAKSYCTGQWLLYLQADEVMHEDDHAHIRELCSSHLDDERVEGILFNYLHFWGDYGHVIDAHGWYRKEIRIIRNLPEIHSWQSAQSFRVIPEFDGKDYRSKAGTRKLRVVSSEARIFHYGWVRPPQLMTEKMNSLDRIHSHTTERYEGAFDYGKAEDFKEYQGSHPAVMTGRIAGFEWIDSAGSVSHRPPHKHERLKYRLLSWIERNFFGGRHLFAFNNYRLIE